MWNREPAISGKTKKLRARLKASGHEAFFELKL
jgi:hypothetical protein